MSSPPSTAKQQPVLALLHEALEQSMAYANAIRDNAQDDRQPISLELVGAYQRRCEAILSALSAAAAE
jgi:hypothetical protein